MNIPHLYLRLELFIDNEKYEYIRDRDNRTPITADFNYSWNTPFSSHTITFYNPPYSLISQMRSKVFVNLNRNRNLDEALYNTVRVNLYGGWQSDNEDAGSLVFSGYIYYAKEIKGGGENSLVFQVSSLSIRPDKIDKSFNTGTYREVLQNIIDSYKQVPRIEYETIDEKVDSLLDHKIRPLSVKGTFRTSLDTFFTSFNKYVTKRLSKLNEFKGDKNSLINGFHLRTMFYNDTMYIYHKNLLSVSGSTEGKQKFFTVPSDANVPILRGENGMIEFPTKNSWYTWDIQSVFRPDIKRPLQNIKVVSRYFNENQTDNINTFLSSEPASKIMKVLTLSHSIGWDDATTNISCADSVYGFVNVPTSPV